MRHSGHGRGRGHRGRLRQASCRRSWGSPAPDCSPPASSPRVRVVRRQPLPVKIHGVGRIRDVPQLGQGIHHLRAAEKGAGRGRRRLLPPMPARQGQWPTPAAAAPPPATASRCPVSRRALPRPSRDTARACPLRARQRRPRARSPDSGGRYPPRRSTSPPPPSPPTVPAYAASRAASPQRKASNCRYRFPCRCRK